MRQQQVIFFKQQNLLSRPNYSTNKLKDGVQLTVSITCNKCAVQSCSQLRAGPGDTISAVVNQPIKDILFDVFNEPSYVEPKNWSCALVFKFCVRTNSYSIFFQEFAKVYKLWGFVLLITLSQIQKQCFDSRKSVGVIQPHYFVSRNSYRHRLKPAIPKPKRKQ